MTAEDRKLLARINKYAEEALADIDPQKVQVGAQLDAVRQEFIFKFLAHFAVGQAGGFALQIHIADKEVFQGTALFAGNFLQYRFEFFELGAPRYTCPS